MKKIYNHAVVTLLLNHGSKCKGQPTNDDVEGLVIKAVREHVERLDENDEAKDLRVITASVTQF